MAVVQQLREVPLAQYLVYAHGDAVGQVQAAAGVPHGHPDAVLLISCQQRLRQTGIFPPEHEVCSVRVGDVGVALGRFGRKVVMSEIAISTIKKIESGKGNPSLSTVEKIMDILGMEVKYEIRQTV